MDNNFNEINNNESQESISQPQTNGYQQGGFQQPGGFQGQSYQQAGFQGQPYQQGFQQGGYQQTGFQGQPYQQGFQQGGFQQPYQQAGFQGQPYQQPITNQYYQPSTNQFIQPGMNMYGYQRTPALSCAKNVVSMVFGIIAFFFSFISGAMAGGFHYIARNYSSYSLTYADAKTGCIITCVMEGIFVIMGLLFGILGLSGKTRGKGMSIAGVICAVLGLVFTVLCGTSELIH